MDKKDFINAGLDLTSNAAMDVASFTKSLLKHELTEKTIKSFASSTMDVYGSVLQTIQNTLQMNDQATVDFNEKVAEIIENTDKDSYENALLAIHMMAEGQKHNRRVNLLIIISLIVLIVIAIVFLLKLVKGVFGWIIFFLLIWLIIKSVMLGKKFFM